MAKKRRRRRPSLVTKGINIGVLLLAFSRPLQILLSGASAQAKTDRLVAGASAGFATGKFDQPAATAFYGPMLAAIILKKAISMVRKTARV